MADMHAKHSLPTQTLGGIGTNKATAEAKETKKSEARPNKKWPQGRNIYWYRKLQNKLKIISR